MWRPEVSHGCLLLSYLVFETGSLTKHGAFSEPRALYVGHIVWPENPTPQDLPIFASPVLGLQVHTAIISSYVGTGDPNSGLMLVRQEIYHGAIPLSLIF